MASLALHALIGIFIYFNSVKGSSQPQARVFLTFNGKKEDKHSEANVMIEHFLFPFKFNNRVEIVFLICGHNYLWFVLLRYPSA